MNNNVKIEYVHSTRKKRKMQKIFLVISLIISIIIAIIIYYILHKVFFKPITINAHYYNSDFYKTTRHLMIIFFTLPCFIPISIILDYLKFGNNIVLSNDDILYNYFYKIKTEIKEIKLPDKIIVPYNIYSNEIIEILVSCNEIISRKYLDINCICFKSNISYPILKFDLDEIETILYLPYIQNYKYNLKELKIDISELDTVLKNMFE